MKAYIYTKDGMKLLRTEEIKPVCGKHFCDTCGDCLACYAGDSCIDGGQHFFVIYEETTK